VYAQFLAFQLRTHPELFEPPEDDEQVLKKVARDEGENEGILSGSGAGPRTIVDEENDDDEEDEPSMATGTAIVVLATCTILTSCCSEYLIDAIEETIKSLNVSKEFIGVILLPIIGNAAEHYTAIVVARKDKMDLSLGVAVGSSCQMALLVTPFTVLVGWWFDRPMSLDFHPFQATVLLLAVLIVANVLQDGSSNWLEGSMLTTAYMSIAVIYYFEDFVPGGAVVYD